MTREERYATECRETLDDALRYIRSALEHLYSGDYIEMRLNASAALDTLRDTFDHED